MATTSAAGTFGARVVLNPVKLAEVLRGPNGPVTRHLIVLGEKVKIKAIQECPVYVPPDPYTAAHRQRRPGTLRDSIVKRVVEGPLGVTILVGSDDPVSLWVHEGTVAHTITARLKPLLVFFSKRANGVIRVKSVNHPGTQPNRFLIRALEVIRGL
jgi:hypothetical protein